MHGVLREGRPSYFGFGKEYWNQAVRMGVTPAGNLPVHPAAPNRGGAPGMADGNLAFVIVKIKFQFSPMDIFSLRWVEAWRSCA
jgi:hypothetical protein